MASLLGEHLLEVTGQAPAPSKDFYQLLVTKKEVILTSWKISLRIDARGASPSRQKESHRNFLKDKTLKDEVFAVFGKRTLDHTMLLCQGQFDYLERLPDDILLKILSYLQLKDTTLLAQVSRRFRKLCNSDKFWEEVVRHRCPEFTSDMEDCSKSHGLEEDLFYLFPPQCQYAAGEKQMISCETPQIQMRMDISVNFAVCGSDVAGVMLGRFNTALHPSLYAPTSNAAERFRCSIEYRAGV
ncbi:F-box only protein 36 [Larimichthys crocea]|uniref:Uncharacterized protein n=1 Tax=Larimichthys crocea TaxID=215358 RepID=A0ACD3QMT9_LARCR|nr:F-box only protein 36 [Larimichthys crocea]